jgi:hypothetical protein
MLTTFGGMALMAFAAAAAADAASPSGSHPLDAFNVTWDSPSRDATGSMPLGNGDLGLNFWVTQGGDFVLYLSKTDAWSEIGRLQKLGRIRIRLQPNPLRGNFSFRQTLHLRHAEISVRAASAADSLMVRLWVDAHRPVVHVEAESRRPTAMQVWLELWRTALRRLDGAEADSAYGLRGAPYPILVYPDTILPTQGDRVVWYHRNEHSIWADTLRWQGMGSWVAEGVDPLLHLTYGGMMRGPGLVAGEGASLHSQAPARHHLLSIYCLTAQTATPEEWLEQLEKLAAAAERVPLEQARTEHRRWWESFWQRSWVRVRGPCAGPALTVNDLPLRLGAASDGSSRFRGYLARARVWGRALTPAEIAALARAPAARLADPALICDYDLGQLLEGRVPNAAGHFLDARVVGTLEPALYQGIKAARFTGQGWLEVPCDPRLQLTSAVTLDAWIAPEQLDQGGARIIDKIPAGRANGYLLDTFPGNSLRMVIEPHTLSYAARLEPGRWVHVAGTYDRHTGSQRLYVDGKLLASAELGGSTAEISQGYALQRFLSACAGRGAYPIKFNGSIFTMDASEGDQRLDADYRRWGGCYWFQNTRLVYWPMLAAGDFDMMLPLFRMYRALLPFAKARTQVYFGHAGAFFPETMYFWGAYATDNYGWDRTNKPVSHVDNPYIRWYFSGGLELCALLLDFYAFTADDAFARAFLLPIAEAVVDFYDQHYRRNEQGQMVFKPAQALETWQSVVNPLPEIAGLRWVLEGLLGLPDQLTSAERRAQWQRLLAALPPLPTTTAEGHRILAPAAEMFGDPANCENPELYAVFPYRLYGVGKPDLAMARETFARRRFRGHWGWQQDDVQAAFLGLAQEAAALVSRRFAMHNPACRFPVFWGPNFDWVPDQDHGCNGLMALQSMLLQWHGRQILLFPAWPRQWDVEFKLHAPLGTTVEGVYRGGKLERLVVTPAQRAQDVILCGPQ